LTYAVLAVIPIGVHIRRLPAPPDRGYRRIRRPAPAREVRGLG
jgi:hypothetical protein